jgi:hypothetical protein
VGMVFYETSDALVEVKFESPLKYLIALFFGSGIILNDFVGSNIALGDYFLG